MVELGNFLHRWFFVDFFVPVWPNIAAAVICTIHITRSNMKHKIYLGEKEGRDHDTSQGN